MDTTRRWRLLYQLSYRHEGLVGVEPTTRGIAMAFVAKNEGDETLI
jgi:hypothetical protein